MTEITVKSFFGKEIAQCKNSVLDISMQVYKEYPFLLHEDFIEHEKIFDAYVKHQNSNLTIAISPEEVAGFLLATPLSNVENVVNAEDDIKKILANKGYNCDEIYYFGVLFILPHWRNKTIGSLLFRTSEKIAKNLNYKSIAMGTFDRKETNPMKPMGYRNIHDFYERFGIGKTDIKFKESWHALHPDGEIRKSINEIDFWIKNV